MARIAVIGAGSWGTALAALLAKNGHQVALWARSAEVARAINETGRNPRYLTNVELPANITATASLAEAVQDAEALVVVIPSPATRSIARDLVSLVASELPICICTKGVEEATGLVPCQVFAEELGNPHRLAALSGPNHAEEVILGVPAGTVIAAEDEACATLFQNFFANETFRVYTSQDVMGVELCAAMKNIVAIAVGMSYGLGFGDNTAAMLIPRGQAEMARLVKACGGTELTCMGLAGTGDMIATCMSKHSRNRRFGEMVAFGKTLEDFNQATHMVAEGAFAAKSVTKLAEKMGVEVPIAQAVRAIVWEGKDLRQVAQELLGRSAKPEF